MSHVSGHADAAFWPVARAFERQIKNSGGGAAVCIYYRGKKVVDLWGGVRDEDGLRPWREDTLSMSFSTSKGIASMLVHFLADRGLLDYDDPVAKHWPEFGAAGKSRITIRELMSHRAGLSRIRPLLDRSERIMDWDYMCDVLARAEARPNGRSAYHALTYGWLVGELAQRVTGRTLPQLIHDELTEPLDLDGAFIGAPPEAQARAAALSEFRFLEGSGNLREAIFSNAVTGNLTKLYRLIGVPLDLEHMRDALVPPGNASLLTSPRILGVPVPAANGLFTARSLARVYSIIAEGGVVDGKRYLKPRTLRRIGEVQVKGRDEVIPMDMGWRLGFHAAFTTRGAIPTAYGHFGFGGSGAWADPTRRLAVAMVNNQLGGTPFGDMRIASIGSAVLQSLDARPRARSWADRFSPGWMEPLRN